MFDVFGDSHRIRVSLFNLTSKHLVMDLEGTLISVHRD